MSLSTSKIALTGIMNRGGYTNKIFSQSTRSCLSTLIGSHTSTSTSKLINKGQQQQQQQHTIIQNQFTSSSQNRQSRSVSTLSEALQHEIDEEAQNPYNDMPSELSDLKLELSNDWTIMDGAKATSTDGAIVNMYKQENLANGSKVTITFHCQDSISPEEMGFLQNAAETAAGVVRGEEDEEEESMPVKFDVLVSRAGKEMRISCTSDAGEATIDGIMVSSSEEGGDDEDMYRGPMIEDLAEGLQASLEVYLREECGVTSDVAAFIAMYADFKEQDEYINWLKNVKNIVG